MCIVSLWGHPVCGAGLLPSVVGGVAAGRETSLSARRHQVCSRLLHNGATPGTRRPACRERGVGCPFVPMCGCNLVFRSRAICPLDNFLCCRTPLFSQSGGQVRIFGAQTGGWGGLQSGGGDQIVLDRFPFGHSYHYPGKGRVIAFAIRAIEERLGSFSPSPSPRRTPSR